MNRFTLAILTLALAATPIAVSAQTPAPKASGAMAHAAMTHSGSMGHTSMTHASPKP